MKGEAAVSPHTAQGRIGAYRSALTTPLTHPERLARRAQVNLPRFPVRSEHLRDSTAVKQLRDDCELASYLRIKERALEEPGEPVPEVGGSAWAGHGR
jgi:hypothetical protein